MTKLLRCMSATLALLALALPAFAQQQQRPERPYRGLFGGGVGNAEQLLTLSVQFGGGYDGNILAGSAGNGVGLSPIAQRAPIGGKTGDASLGLNYTMSRPRV